jgi:hypothetical protein
VFRLRDRVQLVNEYVFAVKQQATDEGGFAVINGACGDKAE